MKRFSLVSTVFNEASRIRQTIADIEAQTVLPDEIVIVDAGSGDGTIDILKEWATGSSIRIEVLVVPKCNVAQGRNIAIQHATHDFILSTDFGCRFEPGWVESLIVEFEDESVDVVGGAFTVRKEEVNTLAAKADYILQNGYPVVMDEFFSVSSRSIAYKKHIWEKIGGYPEWLTLAADDTVFWKLVKKNGFKYTFIDKPNVYWLRHKTFKAFGKEDFRYGLGDGEAGINQRNVASKVIQLILRYMFVPNLLSMVVFGPSFLGLVCAMFQLYGFKPYYYAYRNWKGMPGEAYGVKELFASFWLTEIVRINYIKGYMKGIFSDNPVQKKQASKLKELLV